MTLLFMDGFDHYATGDLAKKYVSTAGAPSIVAAAGRRNTASLRCSGDSVNRAITNLGNVVFGVAFKTSAVIDKTLVILLEGGTQHVTVQLTAAGSLGIYRSGTALTNGNSANGLVIANTWYYLEGKLQIANSISASSCILKLNGTQIVNVDTGQDTQNGGTGLANLFRLQSSSGQTDFDDFYICDLNGSVNNDFIGECRVDTLFPTANGRYAQFTPIGSPGDNQNFGNVDDATDIDDAASYNFSDTAGHRDSFVMSDPATLVNETIKGLQVVATASKDDIGARSLKIGVLSESGSPSAEALDAGTGLSESGWTSMQKIQETDPVTGAAWQPAAVQSVQALYENV